MPDFPYMAYLRLRMRTPRPDGLSSRDFYFYRRNSHGWEQQTAAIMTPFSEAAE